MLNEFVEKIVVHEAEKVNGRNRSQNVDSYLNFIGKFELPQDEAEEPAEPMDQVEVQREKWRANYYKYRDKTLVKKAEQRQSQKAAKVALQPAKTSEELAAEEKARKERKRTYQREYQRKLRQRKREQFAQ